MNQHSGKMAALIGSRICHDLINPIGAVSNGLELMELSGTPRTPELDLVSESASHASARIRFFRLVFGDAVPGQMIASTEVVQVLQAAFGQARVAVSWRCGGDLPRAEVKMALLALMCAEDALGAGGEVEISARDGAWRLRATGRKLAYKAEHWHWLTGSPGPAHVSPGAVQFAILPEVAAQTGRAITVDAADEALTIKF